MGGENDDKAAQAQVAIEPQAQGEQTTAQQMTDSAGGDDAAKARTDYEAALKERDERITELDGQIAGAVMTAESAERMRTKINGLRR